MSIFDKVKSFANKLTGGSAKVFVESDPIQFGKPFEVRIKAIVADESIQIDRVYLNIEGLEEVNVPDVDIQFNQSGQSRRRREHVYKAHQTYEDEIQVAGPMSLAATMTYNWTVQVQIPEGAQPVYHGYYASHIYRIKAGLDMSGNDPDSGWVELK